MADYGHELEFGTFLTPSAAHPEQVVALAQLTERAGLDLVSVQDHPYQPAFLDAWTLLSMLAGVTERVRLFPNVANLPLRPPAVLARSASSLDRLSGGRVELGLGAGAFWEAIEANGGPRRDPAQAVRGLEEAIAILRAIWSGRGPIKVYGEEYRVVGAKPGPVPAHDIAIWIGAYKPQMLRLVGRLADGWLPSLGYVSVADLGGLNRVIDEAAERAGRPAGAIRRLLNINGTFDSGDGLLRGSARDWAEQLAELTLAEGVSAYILGSDDPHAIQRFGQEVAPLVREMVGDERAAARPASEPAVTEDDGTTASARAAGDRGLPDGSVAAAAVPASLGVTPTPDDGKRRSAERPWDESTRPSGPAPDPDRHYTPRQRATGQHLVDVHDHLRGELAQIFDLVDQVEAGLIDVGRARSDLHAMALRQNNWTLGTYCESYCRLVTTHHTIEDASVFPHLRQADPALAPVIDRLEAEHRVIHDVIERVDEALVTLVRPGGDIKALRAAVDLLSDTLLSHLAYEERELVEPLARLGFQATGW